MNWKRNRAMFVTIIILVGSLFFFLPRGAVAEKTYEFVVAHGISPTIPTTPLWEMMKEKLEKYSGGRIKVKIHPSGSLCSEGTCAEQLRQGAIDMHSISGGNYGAFSNNFYILDMPYVFTSREGAQKVLLGPIGDLLKKRAEENDKVKCLAIIPSFGFRHMYNNVKEVKTPAEAAGIKIRTVLSPINQKLVKGWNFTPVNVPWAELYQALQTKVVNGFYIPHGYTYGKKFYEVANFCTETGGQFNDHIFFMDLKKYNSLPDDLKIIVDQAAREVEIASWELDYKWSQKAREKMVQHGMKIYTPTPGEMILWRKLAPAIWEKLVTDKEDKELLKVIQAFQQN